MKRIAPALLWLVASCGGAIERVAGDASGDVLSASPVDTGAKDADASSDDASAAVDADSADLDGGDAAPDPCADAGVPPLTLECAGLYADFASQTVSPS